MRVSETIRQMWIACVVVVACVYWKVVGCREVGISGWVVGVCEASPHFRPFGIVEGLSVK